MTVSAIRYTVFQVAGNALLGDGTVGVELSWTPPSLAVSCKQP